MNALLAPLLALLLGSPVTPVTPGPPGPIMLARAPRISPQMATPPAVVEGDAVWPVADHVVLAGFDPPRTTWSAGHRGVDLAAIPGEQVHAALLGTIAFAGRIAGRGVVVVSHGALRTTYEPVLAWVRVGDPVTTGGVIGVLEPGGHCAPQSCLHWGLRRGTAYLDPLSLLGGRPVRLLPWPDRTPGNP